MASGRAATTADLAERFAVDIKTINRWVARGCPHDGGGRGRPCLFNRGEVVAWLAAEGLTGADGRPVKGQDMRSTRRRRASA